MNFTFSQPVQKLNPSAIREILKYTAGNPMIIPFSAGNPAPEAFPVKEVAEITSRILTEQPIAALQYSITEGYAPLREHLTKYMKEKYSVGTDDDSILITSGAQQAMELTMKTLCNSGDMIICEAPSFIGSLNSFRSLGGKLVGVPVESDGMDMTALEAALKANPAARFIYTIPNFQNPSGVTMSMDKRRRLYALAKEYNVLIVEDNPYGDLRFAGESVPAVKTLDDSGCVLYVGSFSKVLAPGLRVGYAIGPKELIQKMVVCKQGEDVHTAILPQMICHEFMTTTDYEAHLTDLQSIYRKKALLMESLLDELIVPQGITFHRIEGGLFIWCTLPDGVNMKEFCTAAVRDYNVAVVPGTAFTMYEDDPCQSFRINFSTPTDDGIRRGVQALADCAAKFLK